MLFRATTTLSTRLYFRCMEKLNIVLPDIWRNQMLLASLPIYDHHMVIYRYHAVVSLTAHWILFTEIGKIEFFADFTWFIFYIQNWHLTRPSLSQSFRIKTLHPLNCAREKQAWLEGERKTSPPPSELPAVKNGQHLWIYWCIWHQRSATDCIALHVSCRKTEVSFYSSKRCFFTNIEMNEFRAQQVNASLVNFHIINVTLS